MHLKVCKLSLGLLALLSSTAFAQTTHTNFFSAWENRVRATLAKQPSYPIPVIAPSAQMVQLFRFDYLHEYTPARTTTDIYTNGKGSTSSPGPNSHLQIPHLQPRLRLHLALRLLVRSSRLLDLYLTTNSAFRFTSISVISTGAKRSGETPVSRICRCSFSNLNRDHVQNHNLRRRPRII